MFNLKLPFWNSRGNSVPLVRAAQLFWQKIEDSLRWLLTQNDAEHCTESVLKLLAWQRDITRFDGEPLWLFRRRVQYAFINSIDAGSVAGFKRIFERLGVGYIEVQERVEGRDWDVIVLHVSDNQLSQNSALLRVLIEQYGRTCRRYQFEVISSVVIEIATLEFNNTWSIDKARY